MSKAKGQTRPRSVLRVGRFERKILAIVGLAAVAPLIGTLLLGRAALHNAFQTGVNEQVKTRLHHGVDIYRDYLMTLRQSAELTADVVAGSAKMARLVNADDDEALAAHLRQELERYESLAQVRVIDAEQVRVVEGRPSRTGEGFRELVLIRELDAGELSAPEERLGPELQQLGPIGGSQQLAVEIEVTVTVRRALFEEFQRAGTEAELFDRIEQRGEYISGVYLGAFIGLLSLLILLSFAVAGILTRRATGRVAELAEATRKFGRGEMDVRVERGGRDEVGELIDAFNKMVADLRMSQDRIDYLRRISAWQDFARRLAHEIKNPLTPIQLAVQEIQRSYTGEDAAFGQKLMLARDIVEEEVDTLRRLVGEFSEFARLPAVERQRTDLHAFMSELGHTLKSIETDVFGEERAKERVEVILCDDLLPVRIDSMMLKRCLDNLVRNALQSIHDGTGTRVQVKLEATADKARIVVTDDGPGVAEERWRSVFDPYVTTKSEGTGLGLSIVKKIVLEHEGTVVCDSSAEGGARFVIELPRVPDA